MTNPIQTGSASLNIQETLAEIQENVQRGIDFASVDQPKAVSLKPSTEQDEMYLSLRSAFECFFSSMQIQLSSQTGQTESFATFLMERIFGKPESCHIDYKTRSFTLTLAEEKRIPITKLFESKHPEILALFKEFLNSALRIKKVIKGKIENGKLSFERGSLTFDWKWTSAYLLSMSEHPNLENVLMIHGEYLKMTADVPLFVQNFVDLVECNLPK